MSLDKKFTKTENTIPEWHIPILKERLKNMKEGKTVFYNWEEIKNSLFNQSLKIKNKK